MKILKNVSLKKYNTIKIGGPAKIIYFPENHNEIKSIKNILQKKKTLILGNGSNIAFRDVGYKHDLVCFKKLKKSLSLIGTNNIYASAGVSCAKLAKFAHRHNIPGFEFLYGIPGTVGGALRMNAGAFGSEIWDNVQYVTILNKNFDLVKLDKSKFKFSYRKVCMKNTSAFIDVYFKTFKNRKFQKNLLEEFSNKRIKTQPINQWSSGCVFKNPKKNISASSLIDKSHLSRTRYGGIYISNKHCNYFINDGSGSCNDLEKLIKIIQIDIYQQHKVKLEKEICIY